MVRAKIYCSWAGGPALIVSAGSPVVYSRNPTLLISIHVRYMDTEIGTRKCQEYDEKHLQNGLVSFYYKMYLSANKCTCCFWYTFSIYLPFLQLVGYLYF